VAPNNSAEKYKEIRRAHWDQLAADPADRSFLSLQYQKRLRHVYGSLVMPGQQVLELGSGSGDLLASLHPSHGVGVDFSTKMVQLARNRYPELSFFEADVHEIAFEEPFDVILLSDLVNDLWDVQQVFERIHAIASPHTLIVLNSYSRVWELPLRFGQHLHLITRKLPQNWLTVEDITGLLDLAGCDVIRSWQEILMPIGIPFVSGLCNRVLAKLWPLNYFALSNFILARPRPERARQKPQPKVSVVIPARNEAGNIEDIFRRTPEMGSRTELIFVEGHSTDNTYETIKQVMARYPERTCKLMRQPGEGKGNAVRFAFSVADGDILMILDADLTMPPENLPRFYEAVRYRRGALINGVRLVYPMEKKAMRFFNFLGNKFFSLLFTWLIGQPIKDTLCGTKVLWKRDYEQIAANRNYFGDFDPFGDFDLLFGAARLNMKIIEIPIRYAERIYGSTNIQRWRHGVLLLKMSGYAALKLKFL